MFDKIKYEFIVNGKKALEAAEKSSISFRRIKNQTEEICLKAVEKSGDMLQYVIFQTEEICLKAIESNEHAIQYVRDQTPGFEMDQG